MAPKTDIKQRLIEAAVELLERDGPEALQARKLAAEVGASTMAVYTHFGGMAALVDEVAHTGFRRLSAHLARVAETGDPVADIFVLARSYRQVVSEAPQLFGVTFGQTAPGGKRATLSDLTTPEGRATADDGLDAFEHIVRATRRAIDAGRFRPTEPYAAAAQLWSAVHGFVILELSGHFGHTDGGIAQVLLPLGTTLAVGLGDTVEAARASNETAQAVWQAALPETSGSPAAMR